MINGSSASSVVVVRSSATFVAERVTNYASLFKVVQRRRGNAELWLKLEIEVIWRTVVGEIKALTWPLSPASMTR